MFHNLATFQIFHADDSNNLGMLYPLRLRDIAYAVALGVLLLLSGCSSTLPIKEAQKLFGQRADLYGYVVNVSSASDPVLVEACASREPALRSNPDTSPEDLVFIRNQVCLSPGSWRIATANIYGEFGQFVKIGLLVPVSAEVAVDDIVVSSVDYSVGSMHRFKRIAAKSKDRKDGRCDWVGSKVLNTGGVECEGWSFKSLPAFRPGSAY